MVDHGIQQKLRTRNRTRVRPLILVEDEETMTSGGYRLEVEVGRSTVTSINLNADEIRAWADELRAAADELDAEGGGER